LNVVGGGAKSVHIAVILLDGVDVGATTRVVVERLAFSQPPVALVGKHQLVPAVSLEENLQMRQ